MDKHTVAVGFVGLTLLVLLMPAGGAAAAERYDGAELYAMNCANCHGIYGEGDGAVTPDLSTVLLDLRYLSARNDGEFPHQFVASIIDGREVRAAHGPVGMPVWGAVFTRSEGVGEEAQARVTEKIDAIVRFLESIQILE
ncbi:MAG TPA: cytochrome c [Pseudomonadales bacterium]